MLHSSVPRLCLLRAMQAAQPGCLQLRESIADMPVTLPACLSDVAYSHKRSLHMSHCGLPCDTFYDGISSRDLGLALQLLPDNKQVT